MARSSSVEDAERRLLGDHRSLTKVPCPRVTVQQQWHLSYCRWNRIVDRPVARLEASRSNARAQRSYKSPTSVRAGRWCVGRPTLVTRRRARILTSSSSAYALKARHDFLRRLAIDNPAVLATRNGLLRDSIARHGETELSTGGCLLGRLWLGPRCGHRSCPESTASSISQWTPPACRCVCAPPPLCTPWLTRTLLFWVGRRRRRSTNTSRQATPEPMARPIRSSWRRGRMEVAARGRLRADIGGV